MEESPFVRMKFTLNYCQLFSEIIACSLTRSNVVGWIDASCCMVSVFGPIGAMAACGGDAFIQKYPSSTPEHFMLASAVSQELTKLTLNVSSGIFTTIFGDSTFPVAFTPNGVLNVATLDGMSRAMDTQPQFTETFFSLLSMVFFILSVSNYKIHFIAV